MSEIFRVWNLQVFYASGNPEAVGYEGLLEDRWKTTSEATRGYIFIANKHVHNAICLHFSSLGCNVQVKLPLLSLVIHLSTWKSVRTCQQRWGFTEKVKYSNLFFCVIAFILKMLHQIAWWERKIKESLWNTAMADSKFYLFFTGLIFVLILNQILVWCFISWAVFLSSLQ